MLMSSDKLVWSCRPSKATHVCLGTLQHASKKEAKHRPVWQLDVYNALSLVASLASAPLVRPFLRGDAMHGQEHSGTRSKTCLLLLVVAHQSHVVPQTG